MKNKVLPEFQEYLRAKNLVKEKYILFFAHWARKFLSLSPESMAIRCSVKAYGCKPPENLNELTKKNHLFSLRSLRKAGLGIKPKHREGLCGRCCTLCKTIGRQENKVVGL